MGLGFMVSCGDEADQFVTRLVNKTCTECTVNTYNKALFWWSWLLQLPSSLAYGIVRFRSEECDLGIPRQAKAESAFLPSSGSAWVQDLESRA